ncbi:MAG: hypothetical protein ABW022_00225 [Actinoplanes sp.]
MRRLFIVLGLALAYTLALLSPAMIAPALATPTTPEATCTGDEWYVNPDETQFAPTRTVAGFVFEGKDLIHHKTSPIDLSDIKVHTGTFEASTAGKVVFKMETSAPYSTIVQNADGKFWSTAMTYDQVGGQGSPVVNVSDLVGKPTKPGKPNLTADTKVVTFGVGYWDEAGATTVSSITFHGTKHDLTCKPKPTVTPTPTKTATPSPTVSPSASASVSPIVTNDPPPPGAAGPSLPVTGPSLGVWVAVGVMLVIGGVVMVSATRRKTRFIE